MRSFLLIISIIFTLSVNAQIPFFDGDMSEAWDVPQNWSGDTIPASGMEIKLVGNHTIIGTQNFIPSRITIPGGSDITLMLDITIDGTTSQCLQIWGNLTFGTGTYTINAAAGQDGIRADEFVTINSDVWVTVNGGSRGVKVLGNKTLINNGNLVLTGATNTALMVQTMGIFENNGMLSTDAASNDGIKSWGIIINSITGEMKSVGPNNNTNEFKIFDETFTNNGFINSGNGKPVYINGGNFINNGLVKTYWVRVVTQNGTSVNNGFYKYGNAGMPFSDDWGGATITDNGINLKDPLRTTIDANEGNGSVVIANNTHNYSWNTASLQGGHSTSSSRGTGTLNTTNGAATLPANFFDDGTTVDVVSTTWPTHVVLQVKQAVLPVELVKFDVRNEGHSVLINWSTASEINSEYIAVERSQDGNLFKEIGRKDSKGNSNQIIDYTMIDRSPSNGMNYYRLRQVDCDGKIEFSDVQSAIIIKETKSWNVFPTMVSSSQSLSLDLAEFGNKSVKLYIYDMVGNIIWHSTLMGGNTSDIAFGNVSKGIYMISIFDGNTKSTKRITVF